MCQVPSERALDVSKRALKALTRQGGQLHVLPAHRASVWSVKKPRILFPSPLSCGCRAFSLQAHICPGATDLAEPLRLPRILGAFVKTAAEAKSQGGWAALREGLSGKTVAWDLASHAGPSIAMVVAGGSGPVSLQSRPLAWLGVKGKTLEPLSAPPFFMVQKRVSRHCTPVATPSRTQPAARQRRNSGTFPPPGCLVTRSSVSSSRGGGLAGGTREGASGDSVCCWECNEYI